MNKECAGEGSTHYACPCFLEKKDSEEIMTCECGAQATVEYFVPRYERSTSHPTAIKKIRCPRARWWNFLKHGSFSAGGMKS